MIEQDLVDRLRNGDKSAVRVLIDMYGKMVGAIAGRILNGNQEEIEECVADIFFTVWKQISLLREASNLQAFVACIARNTACSRYQAIKRHSNILVLDENAVIADDDVHLAFEQKETVSAVQGEIMKLREPDRELFVRRYYYGESVSSLEKLFLMESKQIYNILFRAKQKIRKSLENQEAIL